MAAITERPCVAEGEIDTCGVLIDLARSWHERVAGTGVNELNALCRKIATSGRVDDRYCGNWRKHTGAQPLTVAGWLLLITVLLAHAGTSERGLALKCLNAAFRAIDVVRSDADKGAMAQVKAWAESTLRKLERAHEQEVVV